MVTGPLSSRHAFNGADLRYLRGALLALSDALGASGVAAAEAVDPVVRALAMRVTAALTDDIGAVTTLLVGWDQDEVPNRASATAPSPLDASGASELRSCSRLEFDLRFLEILAAHTHAVRAGTRAEMIEGFAPQSRSHAEAASRKAWHELAALTAMQDGLNPSAVRPPHDETPTQQVEIAPRPFALPPAVA
jgi:uncharacterized protein (DUF305 family)